MNRFLYCSWVKRGTSVTRDTLDSIVEFSSSVVTAGSTECRPGSETHPPLKERTKRSSGEYFATNWANPPVPDQLFSDTPGCALSAAPAADAPAIGTAEPATACLTALTAASTSTSTCISSPG